MGLRTIVVNNSFLYGLFLLYDRYLSNKRKKLGFCGKNVSLTPPLNIRNPKNVFLMGDNGLSNAVIYATSAKFIMKEHSGSAEGLRVSTGNHAMIVGKFYRTIKEQDKPNKKMNDVIVENDVWIGRNVILLPEVHIARGCTIAAGAVVSKSTIPYSLWGGVPAKFIKFKWTISEILEHETKLYPIEERLTEEQLEVFFRQYNK